MYVLRAFLPDKKTQMLKLILGSKGYKMVKICSSAKEPPLYLCLTGNKVYLTYTYMPVKKKSGNIASQLKMPF